MPIKDKTHDEVRAELLQDPEFAAEYNKTKRFKDITIQLVKYRYEAGLTQAKLADKLNTKQSVISRLESFEYTGMKLDTLINYAEALGLDVYIKITPKKQVQVEDLRKLRIKASVKAMAKRQKEKASKSRLVAS